MKKKVYNTILIMYEIFSYDVPSSCPSSSSSSSSYPSSSFFSSSSPSSPQRQCLEKEELQLQLLASKEAQRELTAEVGDLKDKWEMTREMLEESRENVKNLEKKLSPKAHIATPVCDEVSCLGKNLNLNLNLMSN